MLSAATVRFPVPWSPVLGIARSLLALGTAGTLAFTDAGALFVPVYGRPDAPYCSGPAAIGAFCLTDRAGLDIVRWLCVAVLLVVASGWRPALTAIPHWWIAFSVANSVSLPDGGDQVTQVLTLLLLPAALTDPRRWHWLPPPRGAEITFASARVGVATCLLFVARLQIAGIYFQSSVAKLSHAEWADGTALYYWLNHRTFGAPSWLQPVTDWMADKPSILAGLTWGPLIIELALALSLLFPPRRRLWLLPAGILLHLGIAVTMGLWSFALAMCGAVVLLVIPAGTRLDDMTSLARGLVARLHTVRTPTPVGPEHQTEEQAPAVPAGP
jgi:antimicrobial peptide system SdpB family protein